VKAYFDEEDPLVKPESYIFRKEDVITLKPGREQAWLDTFVVQFLQGYVHKFTEVRKSLIDFKVLENTDSRLYSTFLPVRYVCSSQFIKEF